MNSTRTRAIMTGLAVALVTLTVSTAASAQAWEKVGKDDGVMVWKKEVKGQDLLSFKGQTTVDVTLGSLMTVFLDEKQRKHWVDRYETHQTLAKSDSSQTYRIHFGLPFPVSDRDYVLKSDAFPDPDKKVMVVKIKSVKHAKAPENDCCVRAIANGTYYKFEALEGGKTRITVEVSTDPKGLLPDFLINSIQEKWPVKTLNGLVKQSKGKPEHEDFKGWH